MKSKREIARSSRAMTNGTRSAMTGRSSFQRITKGLAAFLMALALVFAVTSCKTESEEETVYRTVTYSTEHATAPEKLTVTDGTALTAEQLPALTAEGYTFGGWYDGETKAEAGYKVTKDVTLTANWTAVGTGGSDPQNPDTPTAPDDSGDTGKTTTYTVTFTTNGGTEIASQKIESGKTATEPTAPTKDGYIFGGWFTDSNFTKAFTFSTAITADITLYAKWIEASKPTYTVTFTVDGAETKQTVAEGEKATKPADPTKAGYTFSGWYNGESAFDFGTAITANITLTAKWTASGTGGNDPQNPEDNPTVTTPTVGGFTVTIAPVSTIGVAKTVSDDCSTITLTADSGFTGYAWLIDGTAASSVTGATVSEDGKTLTLAKANLTENAVYQVSLSATKDGIPYGAQISVKKEPARN
ncbi:MAG: InlB B-repeat-containing protein [Treponema sp.]|nr:InlB B-repeat-containing protein [Treponema sp.]